MISRSTDPEKDTSCKYKTDKTSIKAMKNNDNMAGYNSEKIKINNNILINAQDLAALDIILDVKFKIRRDDPINGLRWTC